MEVWVLGANFKGTSLYFSRWQLKHLKVSETEVCLWWFWDVESFEYFCNQWQMLAQARVKCNLEERRKVWVLSSVHQSWTKQEPELSSFWLVGKVGPELPLSPFMSITGIWEMLSCLPLIGQSITMRLSHWMTRPEVCVWHDWRVRQTQFSGIITPVSWRILSLSDASKKTFTLSWYV